MLGGNQDRDAPITLCIFPHQREFIAVDTREGRQKAIHVLTVDQLTGGEFVSSVEHSFEELIRTPGIGFTDLISIPQQIELAMRVHALRRVLALLQANDDLDVEDESGAVGLLFFSGPMLAIGNSRLSGTLREIFSDKLTHDELETLSEKLRELINAERKAEKAQSAKSIEGLIRGDDGPFVTIWRQDSDD
jgi:hypothetical protein